MKVFNQRYLEKQYNTKIYLIKVNNFYKIGYSSNPKKRLGQVKTNSPYMASLIYESIYVKHAIFVESFLHSLYYKKKVRGEWFRLTDSNIKYINDKSISFIDSKLKKYSINKYIDN